MKDAAIHLKHLFYNSFPIFNDLKQDLETKKH